jgi:hypothetical protein
VISARVKRPKRLPVVLTREQVYRILEALALNGMGLAVKSPWMSTSDGKRMTFIRVGQEAGDSIGQRTLGAIVSR